MKVAFVIPHMGRTDYLRQTLRSIQGQHGFDGEVEVIVVSKDEISGEELWSSDQFDKSKRLRCLTVDSSLSISAQRNVGVRETDGELIAFIDADIELAPAWLKTMSALLFENDQRIIVSAAQIPSNSATYCLCLPRKYGEASRTFDPSLDAPFRWMSCLASLCPCGCCCRGWVCLSRYFCGSPSGSWSWGSAYCCPIFFMRSGSSSNPQARSMSSCCLSFTFGISQPGALA